MNMQISVDTSPVQFTQSSVREVRGFLPDPNGNPTGNAWLGQILEKFFLSTLSLHKPEYRRYSKEMSS